MATRCYRATVSRAAEEKRMQRRVCVCVFEVGAGDHSTAPVAAG
jgi:uncharacterized protein (DUF1501 family)